jgi:hypothetical protein
MPWREPLPLPPAPTVGSALPASAGALALASTVVLRRGLIQVVLVEVENTVGAAVAPGLARAGVSLGSSVVGLVGRHDVRMCRRMFWKCDVVCLGWAAGLARTIAEATVLPRCTFYTREQHSTLREHNDMPHGT